MARILVVEDSPTAREQLKDVLVDEGHDVEVAEGGREALAKVTAGEFDLVLTDLWMPEMDGLDLLREVKSLGREVGVIIITGKSSVRTAQEAFREGALDYVTKDAMLADAVAAVTRAAERLHLRRENRMLHEALHEKYAFDRIVGVSPQIRSVFETMHKVLFTDTTVLISGETGSGKELVAKALHVNGKRRAKPFVAVNCAAISPQLLESELFGHEKGSFTGAVVMKEGLFEAANGGTIFLDEVSELPKDLQGKLLRVLQEREVQRVGATVTRPIDVRVIAATNRDLRAEIEVGSFRADLFYRLNVVPIPLPPLRGREGDVVYLASHFLREHCLRYGVPPKRLDGEAEAALLAYDWPGNVRELENEIERAVNLCDAEVLTADVFVHLKAKRGEPGQPSAVASVPLELRSLAAMEREHILAVIAACGGKKTEAARILEIDYSTLYRKLKRMGID